MTSNERPEPPAPFEIAASAVDREMLERVRRETPSWLIMDWREIERLLPPHALDRRAPARDSWTPFAL
jgi:hypothetical protein